MDFQKYQEEARRTDQSPGSDLKSLIMPLLGLAGEAGSLLTEYKKHLRDGAAYRIFDEQISEELGDILWYLSNIADKAGLDLSNVAERNLAKIQDRWRIPKGDDGEIGVKPFDHDYPANEQLPREFRVSIDEICDGGSLRVVIKMDGNQIGNDLTDNAYVDDGYRFHDIFHLSYVAILGWSPVIRKLLEVKRKSDPKVDEVEDGARATVLEEAISALVFQHAASLSYFDDVKQVGYDLLKTIKNLTAHLEVSRCSMALWEKAILDGFRVWRKIVERKQGVIVGNMLNRSFQFEAGNQS